jgi:hypothetical protein
LMFDSRCNISGRDALVFTVPGGGWQHSISSGAASFVSCCGVALKCVEPMCLFICLLLSFFALHCFSITIDAGYCASFECYFPLSEQRDGLVAAVGLAVHRTSAARRL